jgi:membrane associated rhomboid family serine protease
MYNVTVTLIVINLAVFLLNNMVPRSIVYLGLYPQLVRQNGFVWQLFTYMFVHAGFRHILFNMIALFFVGQRLENEMGSTEFLVFYLTCGVGAGLVSMAMGANVVGASGAVYAALLAFAAYFPNSQILLFYVLPVRTPVAVAILAGFALFAQISGVRGGIAHFAHLAGLIFGYLYLLLRLDINAIKRFINRY